MSQIFSQLTKRSRTNSFGYASTSSSRNSGLYRKPASRPARAVKGHRAVGGKLTAAKVRSIARREIKNHQEVKFLDGSHLNQTVAQVFVDASGHNTLEMDITPAQGTGLHGRIGDSILGDTLIINMQNSRMVNSAAKISLQHYVVAFYGNNPSVVIADFLDPNIALGALNLGTDIYDKGSLRDPAYKGTIKVLGAFQSVLETRWASDGTATVTNGNQHAHVVDLKGMNIEYDADSGALANVKIALITVADGGNRGSSSSSLLGLINNTQTSGVTMQVGVRFTYRDA